MCCIHVRKSVIYRSVVVGAQSSDRKTFFPDSVLFPQLRYCWSDLYRFRCRARFHHPLFAVAFLTWPLVPHRTKSTAVGKVSQVYSTRCAHRILTSLRGERRDHRHHKTPTSIRRSPLNCKSYFHVHTRVHAEVVPIPLPTDLPTILVSVRPFPAVQSCDPISPPVPTRAAACR